MFSLDEMIEVKGTAAMIRGFVELLRGIDSEPSLDEPTSEELYVSVYELFPKLITEMLRYKAFLLWSDPDYVTVHILDTSEECKLRIKDAEGLFNENPLPDTGDAEMDEFARRNRFAREINFEQLLELAKDEFTNPNNYSVSECGLEYIFEDRTPVVEARAAGRI